MDTGCGLIIITNTTLSSFFVNSFINSFLFLKKNVNIGCLLCTELCQTLYIDGSLSLLSNSLALTHKGGWVNSCNQNPAIHKWGLSRGLLDTRVCGLDPLPFCIQDFVAWVTGDCFNDPQRELVTKYSCLCTQKTHFWKKRGTGDHKGLGSVYAAVVGTHRLSENEMGTKKPVAAALLLLRQMQIKQCRWNWGCSQQEAIWMTKAESTMGLRRWLSRENAWISMKTWIQVRSIHVTRQTWW